LPVLSSKQCFKIVRLENGPIKDLVNFLLDLVGNRMVPGGSVVLIGSITHPADVGLAAYIQDLLEAESTLRSKLGRDIRVVPLPPMLMSGVLIREIFELHTWAESYYHKEIYLAESTNTALDLIRRSGEGSQTFMEPKRMRLPARNKSGTSTWHSGGSWVNNNSGPLLYGATALQQPEEKRLITDMINKIRDKLAIALDPSPAFERGLGGQEKPKQSIDFVVAGSSNASKLCSALEAQGFACSLVFMANWRISPSSVEEMRIQLKEEIWEKEPTTVVFFLMDSSVYYGRPEDGSNVAAKKLVDGRFHLEGEVAVCGRDTLLHHFNAIEPLLALVGRKRGIIITPLPRYIIAGCCSDPGHCSNRRFQDF
jgi:hypothetical protein